MEENDLKKNCKLVLIGGSAGSLEVLMSILPKLKPIRSFAIAIILHRKSAEDSTLEDLIALKTTILCSIFFCYNNECKKIILLLILLTFLLFSTCLMYLLYISNKLNFDERVNKLNFKDK